MAYDSMRSFIEALEGSGDIVRVKKEVDWDLEVGAIGRRCYEMEGPTVLFEKIKDYPEGFRIFNGFSGTYPRIAIALDLPHDASISEIHHVYEEREKNPLKPRVVERSQAECKENVLLGEDVDLYKFPAPMIHEGDGGRYIATWDVVVNEDPEKQWTNWGMYRFMIHNEKTLTGYPTIHSHLGMTWLSKFVHNNKKMPIAIVAGADPLCHIVATAGYGIGEDEADYAGALAQRPVELVKCETSDLLVPAHSEIVIEGELIPDRTAIEGPFGEYPGYRTEGARSGALCEVKAITYRNDPILSMISLGVPLDDSSVAASLTAGVSMKRRLKRHGLPVTDVFAPPHGVTHLIIVSVEKGGIDMVRKVGEVLTARRAWANKIVVVDDDIDVFNMGEVMHAIASKWHPGRGTIHKPLEAGKANTLTPGYSMEERRSAKGDAVFIDATWPLEWPEEHIPVKSSFDCIYPRKIQEEVLKNWKDYGF
ncbi:MAG: UbiD family decarboxylase [Desulfatiglandales bacterium]|jgi:4-hydroxy-3-polyprenylbenzoate decarboxylase|nr:UbiD family decarboxylase [Desulfatiglandales bacterium]